MREIINEMRRLLQEPNGGALVTIIRTTGSTYRREGAKMLCRKDGSVVGSVSGGCLEADIAELSLEVVANNQPQTITYDTSSENEKVWGLGLGCNGTVEVLIEPLQWWREPPGRALFQEILGRVNKGRRCAVATVLAEGSKPVSSLRRIIVDADGKTIGSLGLRALESALSERASSIVSEQTIRPSQKVTVEQDSMSFEVFVDALVPPMRLLIVGGGHDAIPLVKLAHEVGMIVTVIDGRAKFATHERFPQADEVICAQPEEVLQKVSIEGETAVVLMTHNYQKDRTVLGQILTAPFELAYIGALGPRVRTQQILDELRGQGLKLQPEKLAAIRTPVGLDIGAETPEEIALAIVAELYMVKNRRSGIPLRDKKGAIHAAA
ncbi:MAG: XdhC family protein [Candidatus Binataceae bacterium]|jgi:xanthine/CO dehydrogenase XdhC/CoxF family maturation factor